MNPDRWREISPYLDQALALEKDDRTAWLESLRTSRPDLSEALYELLTQHELLVQEQFLEGIAVRRIVEGAFSGQIAGAYRLTSLIGEGGMGSVWLAERCDGRFERRVAIKFLHASVGAGHMERFEREGRILGQLRHPHIAELMDAGIAQDGKAYLVLEYVEGTDITLYCDEKRLDINARIRLFLDVLDAVAHAHAHLVVHRDIKPSNVLVGADGAVKLLDFGIAKLLAGESEAASPTLLTMENGGGLTPLFAAPEQLNSGKITTATDVYALGILLYLMLTGQHPAGPNRRSAAELVLAILHTESPSLSEGSPSAEWDAVANLRSTATEKLRRQLRGDLNTIVHKALKKNPPERYRSVGEFADDLRRYLKQEPIRARPDTITYRTAKFIGRNKFPVLGAAAVVAALASGLTVAIWEANRARNEARTAAAVAQFTENIFRQNNRENPSAERAQHTTARQLLDMGAQQAATSLNDAPEAKLKLLDLLGSLYQDLEVSDQAVNIRKQKVALAKKLYGPQSPEVVSSLIDLGRSMHSSRFVNEREAVLLEAKSILDRKGDNSSKDRGGVLSALAENYTSSDVKKAAELARASVAILRRWPGSSELAEALRVAGFAYFSVGQFDEAESVMDEAIQLSKRLKGDPNTDLPQYYATLGQAQITLMKYAHAEDSYRNGYRYAKQLSGEEDVDTFMTEGRLGMLLVATSRSKEALPYLEKGLNACLRTKGPEDPFFTPQMEMQYGIGLEAYGRLEDALIHISKAVRNRRANRPGTVYLAGMLEDQAEVLIEMGRFPAAEASLNEEEAILKKVNAKPNDAYFRPRIRLALEQNRFDEAQALANKLSSSGDASAKLSVGLIRSIYAKAEIALAKQNTAEALSLSSELQKRLADAGLNNFLEVWRIRAQTWEARARLLQHHPHLAISLLAEVVDRQRATLDANSPELAVTEAWLGEARLESGDRTRAAELFKKSSSRLKVHLELCPGYIIECKKLERNLQQR